MYFEYYILSALLPILISEKYREMSVFVCILVGAVVSGWGAISAITGLCSPIYIPSMDITATVFSLLFSIIFLSVVPSAGVGLRHSGCPGSANALHWSVIIVLYYALQGVLMADSAFGFLFYWELMSVALFVLVAFNSSRREVMHTAVSLFVVMHAAFFVLLGAFVALPSGGGLFAGATISIALWILFFVAFMVKSAVFPLHFWLPRTYMASPSWVAALMGGAVTNIGIYGIIRITGAVDDLYAASLCLMVVGAVSALYGAMRLPSSHSLSKLLSYSSIDNIGLILLALGLGFYGVAVGNPHVAMWGFVGGTMQLIYHGLAKALLFLSVGSITRAVDGLDNTSALGGLVRSMPRVSLVFALGAMSLMAIVPMGGFWSEFAIFSSIFMAIESGAEPVVGVVAILVVSLCAAVTIFSFSKSFAVAFLGVARTKQAAQATAKSSVGERLSMWILSAALLLSAGFVMWGFSSYGARIFNLNGIDSPPQANTAMSVALVCGIFITALVVLWFIRRTLLRGRIQREEPTWSCAGGETEPDMQYTDESFAREARQVFSVPDAQKSVTTATRHFVPARVMRRLTRRLALLQTGRTSHYIMHIILFFTLILLLTLTKVI